MLSKALELIKLRMVEKEGRRIVPFVVCREAAREAGISPREAEVLALENGICPSRYERNIGIFGMDGQARLLRSRAAIVGCGGLGGWIAEILARSGVGELVLFDGDTFDDSNLNRQLFANEENLGMAKADVAAARVRLINGAVEVAAHTLRLDESNAPQLLRGSDVVVDALDSNSSRREVFLACRGLGVPFVHGAVGGFFGQVGVFYPGDKPLWMEDGTPDKGVEAEIGTPPFTPPFVAALQAAEAVKILAGLEGQLCGSLLWFDIKRYESQNIKLEEAE